MNIIEIMEELGKHSKEEIEAALFSQMCKGKIDFLSLNNAYVHWLKYDSEDKLNQLIEAETCVIEGFMDKVTKEKKDTPMGKRNYNHTQRCLYLLNKSKRFQTSELNKKYNYDEEYGKTMSWYEREKSNKL